MTIFMCKNHVSFLPLLTALQEKMIHEFIPYLYIKTAFSFYPISAISLCL